MNLSTLSSRALVAGFAVCLAAALAGCQSGGGEPTGDGGDPAGRVGSDSVGTTLLDTVRITGIDRSSTQQDGVVRYTVENVSGQDQEDLVWSVSYVFPSRDSGGDIVLAEEAETTAERVLVLFRGEKGKVLVATCGALEQRRAQGQKIVGTRLVVAANPPVFPFARTAAQEGTKFASGRLECVGQSSIWGEPGSPPPDALSIELENVSKGPVANLELQVVFSETNARTKYVVIPATQPGERTLVTVDLRGLDLGGRDFLVKVRPRGI